MKVQLKRVVPGHYIWVDVGNHVYDVVRGGDPEHPNAWAIFERETELLLGSAETLPLVREHLREHIESE